MTLEGTIGGKFCQEKTFDIQQCVCSSSKKMSQVIKESIIICRNFDFKVTEYSFSFFRF